MRFLPLMMVLAGCSPAPVALTFTASTNPAVGSGYNNSVPGSAVETATELVLTSSAGGATFRIQVDPIKMPTTVAVSENHLEVDYSLGQAGWTSNGGSLTFNTVDPYDVTFNDLEMRAATSGTAGKFTLNGSAMFKK